MEELHPKGGTPRQGLAEKERRKKKMTELHFADEKYKQMFKLAKEEWLLSTDGVVHGLRYDAKDKVFVAKVRYMNNDKKAVQENIHVTDDWVFDTFGKDIASKLMDRGENEEFVQPLDEKGALASVKVDQRRICGLRYHPAKYKHIYEEDGTEVVTKDVLVPAKWKAKLDDDSIVVVNEETVTQFGTRFTRECMSLAN